MTSVSLHSEFAQVIACTRCSFADDHNLLRDDSENLPQPGYVGPDYWQSRVLLVGQNPGTPKSRALEDLPYMAALRALHRQASPERYAELSVVLQGFIPQWPVHNNYFPLAECGLSLRSIAYCNIVRCRTSNDKAPASTTVANCLKTHFSHWLSFLSPRVVVFIGKWAAKRGSLLVENAGIPHAYINRQRSLSTAARVANRAEVIALVRAHGG